jgi:hypothetical protein
MLRAGLLDEIDPTVWREAFVTDSRAVGDGESTLRYLSRYVFRVAISHARIVSITDGRVRFRWKKSGSRRWRAMEVDADEFLQRFLCHVLPPDFQKVRYFGFLSPQSAVSIEKVRALALAENAAARDALPTAAHEQAASTTTAKRAMTEPTCAVCGSRLRVVEVVFHRVAFRDSG